MRRLTKFIVTVLVFILAFSPLTLINAGAVEIPQGLTEGQIQSAIPKMNTLLKALLASGGEDTDIKGMLYGTLFEDKTVNTLFAEIYKALGENADTLSMIGVSISPQALSNALSACLLPGS